MISKSISINSKKYVPLLKSGSIAVTRPPMLPPNVYLQYLQAREKFPKKSEFEALKLAYQWDKDPPILQNIKKEVNEISGEKDNVIGSLSSPILGGFAQPLESPSLFFDGCFCCGKIDHGSMDCPESSLSQCCYCGNAGHITFECPLLHGSPTRAFSENSTTEKVKSEEQLDNDDDVIYM